MTDHAATPGLLPFVGDPIILQQAADTWPEVRILAIDIGAHGAVALLDEAGELLAIEDLPTLNAGPVGRPEISAHLFAAFVRRWNPARAWVEGVGPRQTDGPRAAFSFGASRATIEAVLAALDVPFRRIQPATWKRACSIPPGAVFKDLARSKAMQRWPAHAELFSRACDHDRAEAALIGWVGLRQEAAGR